MAGDDIVTNWIGDINADVVTPTTTAQRFSSGYCRCRTVLIFNEYVNCSAYVGKYYSDDSEFRSKAYILPANAPLKLEYIDKYELGYRKAVGDITLQIWCLNEY